MVAGFEQALPANATMVADLPGLFDPAKARESAADMIEAHPDLDYVFVANEEMALGARQVFDAAGADVRIVTVNGIDEGLQAVRDGRLSAPVATPPRTWGGWRYGTVSG
ncbi:sugar ABC transporter substrate-binding protein [Streptomyces sp. NPDC005576]|uniref:sugar ABC transporter substrate-binding protein n=1 Tax=Streptomyces sp. NPDC005576 TaxID=3364726 RepID=UPI003699C07E